MNQFAITGVITTGLVHGAAIAALLGFSMCSDAEADSGRLKMTTIEAALAYKSTEKTRQPQKRRNQRQPQVEPKGVSRDENQKPTPKKPEDQKVDYEKQFQELMNKRQRDEEFDDEEMEEQDTQQPGGKFDGSEHGFAEADKGDPYMRELAADMYSVWELPTLETGTGSAVGCVRLGAEGKIVDTKFERQSENANLNRSVKDALRKLEKKRNKNPKPVPKHLLDATTHWICFTPSV